MCVYILNYVDTVGRGGEGRGGMGPRVKAVATVVVGDCGGRGVCVGENPRYEVSTGGRRSSTATKY